MKTVNIDLPVCFMYDMFRMCHDCGKDIAKQLCDTRDIDKTLSLEQSQLEIKEFVDRLKHLHRRLCLDEQIAEQARIRKISIGQVVETLQKAGKLPTDYKPL